MKTSSPAVSLKRDLGLWSAVAIVIGTVIGSGIFIVPNTMTRNVGTPAMVFVVWIAGGLMSLSGALSYAELSAAMPWRMAARSRLSARGLRTAVELHLRLDPDVGRQKRIHSHAGDSLRALFIEFHAGLAPTRRPHSHTTRNGRRSA